MKSAMAAVFAAGALLAQAAPASAAAATAGVKAVPASQAAGVTLVRRGGHGGGFRSGGGGHRAFGGGGGRRSFGGGGGRRLFSGGGGYRSYGHRRHRHWRPSRGIYFAAPYVTYRSYSYGSCRWLKRKAIRTGSSYWWRRYNRCRYNYDW